MSANKRFTSATRQSGPHTAKIGVHFYSVPAMIDRDQIYAKPQDIVGDFAFDQSVVDVFPDMIERSVPGYGTIIRMIGHLAQRYAKPSSRIYDLGCSLGAASLSICQNLNDPSVSIEAVDNSQEMIDKFTANLAQAQAQQPIQLHCADMTNIQISEASMCILNFTLQFVPPAKRAEFIGKIARGLLAGGVLILSEKICFEDAEHQALMVELHHNFKRGNGYSDLEIAQKRTALENVLIPETLNAHKERLLQAGFRAVDCWFQCYNFASIIAFK